MTTERIKGPDTLAGYVKDGVNPPAADLNHVSEELIREFQRLLKEFEDVAVTVGMEHQTFFNLCEDRDIDDWQVSPTDDMYPYEDEDIYHAKLSLEQWERKLEDARWGVETMMKFVLGVK